VLVSDAGTPGISDPGERLVRAVVDADLPVSAVPGPAAVVMALVISGLPTSRFVFEGFLPRSGGERAERLADVAAERRTTVLYEAPHRLVRTVTDLCDRCGGDRRIVLARELTKLHEQVWRGTLADAVAHVANWSNLAASTCSSSRAPPRPPRPTTTPSATRCVPPSLAATRGRTRWLR
jgi:16S rRNA (cytidine1402-2'-O)-methyltransferase